MPPESTAGPSGSDPVSLRTSGTRIKARVMRTAAGTKHFVGWKDTQLDVNCEFVTASDGKTRCVPVLPALSSFSGYFADAACTVRVAAIKERAPDCASITQLRLMEESPPVCGKAETRFHVLPVGAPHLGTAYYRSAPQEPCTEYQRAEGVTLYTLGPAVNPSEYEEAGEGLE